MLYDQFIDRMIDMPTPTGFNSEEDIILKYKAGKNIIYLNKPQDIENFALKLAKKLPPVNSSTVNSCLIISTGSITLCNACKKVSSIITAVSRTSSNFILKISIKIIPAFVI